MKKKEHIPWRKHCCRPLYDITFNDENPFATSLDNDGRKIKKFRDEFHLRKKYFFFAKICDRLPFIRKNKIKIVANHPPPVTYVENCC